MRKYILTLISMKNFVFLAILFISCEGTTQSRIAVNMPTAASETDYIWSTLQDINFFEENKYPVNLPKGKLITSLKNKAKEDNLSEKDYEDLKLFVSDSVYKKAHYKKGYDKIKNELSTINTMISELNNLSLDWSFKTFEVYKVNLTLYGPGGTYNPDEGSILIYTTPNGEFKQYHNPANTIMHEIVHIGIQTSIIEKFNVPHAGKERIVDNFVLLSFKDDLPNYKLQDMGDNRIDAYLKTKNDLKFLNQFVSEMMKDNP
ncbi:hypothetical protein [Spongiimicrobium sp. 3-5]|uniref:hypothetical protein n=1 Tax=Spongiimicrobium sp. 3-5 TaxID=3332596 RepID=UPI003980743A